MYSKFYLLYNAPDGLNINVDCGSTHIEGLQRFVVEKGLDVGFAFDGDADRCLCVDEKGNLVDGDAILYIYGRYLKERGKLVGNKVVMTIMNNFGLCKALEAIDVECEKTNVGDKYVYEAMLRSGYRLGGEQTGHIIFKKYATTGDGILTAIKMMEVMLEKKATLSELAQGYKAYPQVVVNVRVADKDAVMTDGDVQAALQEITEALGSDGRILLRKSGTEPVVRVMAEAGTRETCQAYVDRVVSIIENKGYRVG